MINMNRFGLEPNFVNRVITENLLKSKSVHDHEQIKNDAQLLYLYFFEFLSMGEGKYYKIKNKSVFQI
jgi:hypothetical protein